MTDNKTRCAWARNDDLMRRYHDEEWGVPVRDSRELWELLMLEGFQAGLAWIIILRKREGFRKAFESFEPKTVAGFEEDDIIRLMANPEIVRARAKIQATITGAKIYLAMQAAGEDFSEFIWSFTKGKTIRNSGPVPASSELSETISKALKKKGFKFVGPVIVYAFLQAAGIVNDHSETCFRRKAVSKA